MYFIDFIKSNHKNYISVTKQNKRVGSLMMMNVVTIICHATPFM